MEDVLKELVNKQINDILDTENQSKPTNNQKKDFKKLENIYLKGNTIIYKNKIFIYNYNASRYNCVKKRKIYYSQYHFHLINKLRKQGKYHDGMKNEGFIAELDDNLKKFIKNNVSYILIY